MQRLLLSTLSVACFALPLVPTTLHADSVGHFTFTDRGSTITIDRFTHYIKGGVIIPPTINGKPVTEIDDYAFNYCRRITSVSIPDSVTRIGKSAFYGCDALLTVNIPSGLTSIENDTFYGCRELESISLPDGITHIGSGAFRSCANLKTFEVPPKVTTLSEAMLAGCSGIDKFTIPPQVKRIEDQALGYTGIRSIRIPATVEFLGDSQFIGCVNLRRVEIQTSITEVGDSMFTFCRELREVTLPKSVWKIGTGAFRESGITAPPLDGIREISRGAFRKCKNLTSVRIPKSVTRIGNEAFFSCRRLSGVSFEGGAPEMGVDVFSYAAPDFRIFAEVKSHNFTIPRWHGYKLSRARAEIVVRDSAGKLVQNGDTLISKFGIVPVGTQSPSKSFVITNVGNRPLTNISAGLEGVGLIEFPIAKPAASTLAPGASTTLKVAFEPLVPRKRTSFLRIRSSDADEGAFIIPLSGIGTQEL